MTPSHAEVVRLFGCWPNTLPSGDSFNPQPLGEVR